MPKPGPEHPRWNGGEIYHVTLGRWLVNRNGERVFRYRAVMEEHLGRRLTSDEHVHHINGDSTDDRLENLKVVSATEHREHHGGMTPEMVRMMLKMAAAGMSQRAIARTLGVSQSSISRRLHGRKKKAA